MNEKEKIPLTTMTDYNQNGSKYAVNIFKLTEKLLKPFSS